MTALDDVRARLDATATAERCPTCLCDRGRHTSDCPHWTCLDGVQGGCAYCRSARPADEHPNENEENDR